MSDGGTLLLMKWACFLLAAGEIADVPRYSIIHAGGRRKSITINARLLAATNRDLRKEVENGRFRGDLFFRLNVLSIELPPLRKRLEDLPNLVKEILEDIAREIPLPETRRWLLEP